MTLALKFAYIFSVTLGLSILLFLLRGNQIVTFLPGGILLALIILAMGSGLTYLILVTKR